MEEKNDGTYFYLEITINKKKLIHLPGEIGDEMPENPEDQFGEPFFNLLAAEGLEENWKYGQKIPPIFISNKVNFDTFSEKLLKHLNKFLKLVYLEKEDILIKYPIFTNKLIIKKIDQSSFESDIEIIKKDRMNGGRRPTLLIEVNIEKYADRLKTMKKEITNLLLSLQRRGILPENNIKKSFASFRGLPTSLPPPRLNSPPVSFDDEKFFTAPTMETKDNGPTMETQDNEPSQRRPDEPYAYGHGGSLTSTIRDVGGKKKKTKRNKKISKKHKKKSKKHKKKSKIHKKTRKRYKKRSKTYKKKRKGNRKTKRHKKNN